MKSKDLKKILNILKTKEKKVINYFTSTNGVCKIISKSVSRHIEVDLPTSSSVYSEDHKVYFNLKDLTNTLVGDTFYFTERGVLVGNVEMTLPPPSNPEMEELELENDQDDSVSNLTLSSNCFADLMKKIGQLKSDHRLRGGFFKLEDGHFYSESTNGACALFLNSNAEGDNCTFSLWPEQQETLSHLRSEGEDVEVEVGKSCITFRSGGVVVKALHDKEYFSIREALSRNKLKHVMSFSVKPLLNPLKMYKALKEPVTLHTKEDGLYINNNKIVSVEPREELELPFNPDYLLKGIQLFDGYVTLEVKENGQMIMLKDDYQSFFVMALSK